MIQKTWTMQGITYTSVFPKIKGFFSVSEGLRRTVATAKVPKNIPSLSRVLIKFLALIDICTVLSGIILNTSTIWMSQI
jgi:hypothetical protein